MYNVDVEGENEENPRIVPWQVMPSKVVREHDQDVRRSRRGFALLVDILLHPQDFWHLEPQKESKVRQAHCSDLNSPIISTFLLYSNTVSAFNNHSFLLSNARKQARHRSRPSSRGLCVFMTHLRLRWPLWPGGRDGHQNTTSPVLLLLLFC